MAWIGTDISAADLAYFAADKPLLGASSLKRLVAAKWCTTADGSDTTDSSYPVTRLYDGFSHLTSRPTETITTHWLQIRPSGASADAIDGVLVLGLTNLSGVTLSVRIADDAAYTVNNEVIASSVIGSSTNRVAFLDLQDSGASVSQRYTTPYLWLHMTKGGSFKPEIGEVFLIRRRQMSHFPLLPFDPNSYASDFITRRTRSGIITTYVTHSGRQELDARFAVATTADRDEINSFIGDTGHGTEPFVWVYEPTSNPNDFRVMQMLSPGELAFPFLGPFERQFTVRASEQGPDFQSVE